MFLSNMHAQNNSQIEALQMKRFNIRSISYSYNDLNSINLSFEGDTARVNGHIVFLPVYNATASFEDSDNQELTIIEKCQ